MLFRIYHFIIHRLTSTNTFGHGVQSPFLFRFIQNVLYDKNSYYQFRKIEELRTELLKENNTSLTLTDYGTGSKKKNTISNIAKKSLKNERNAQMLFKAVHFVQATTVLELGTSLGITTAYIASPPACKQCTTLEGSKEVAELATKNLQKLALKNIKIVCGNIDDTLHTVLNDKQPLDFVFFDANHRKEPTLNYFKQCVELIHDKSVFVFDDIYWSSEMYEAWKTIKKHRAVTATFDLYNMGIVFFNPHFPKKNYKLTV